MRAAVLTHPGLEEISEREIKERLGKDASCFKTYEGIVIFDCKDIKSLEKLGFYGQSIIKVLSLISYFPFSEEDLRKNIKDSLEKHKQHKTFVSRCKKASDEIDISCSDTERFIGKTILESPNNKDAKVDIKEPEEIIYSFISKDICIIGRDITKNDLSKRDYKIFIHPASLKGTIAFAVLMAAGYKRAGKEEKAMTVLDPFCGGGTIILEAALYQKNISQNRFTKNRFPFEIEEEPGNEADISGTIIGYDHLLKHVNAVRKNAKVAGVLDHITASKIELSWLDTKIKESSVDIIATDPPRFSKHTKEKDYRQLSKELFYQGRYLLKKKGNITLITNNKSLKILEEEAKKERFLPHKIIDVRHGAEEGSIVTFINSK